MCFRRGRIDRLFDQGADPDIKADAIFRVVWSR